jgi:Ca-activated chloride channel homolog
MPRFLSVSLLMLFAVFSLSAQSGRRVTVKPTPMGTPVVVDDGRPKYSETKPRPGRPVRAGTRFPTLNQKDTKAPAEPAAATGDDSEETIRVETNLITIPVSVFDRNGLYIGGLDQHNFKIFEDGVEQEIAYFGTTERPFTVAVVIDVSPSTAYKIEEIQAAAKAFVDQLKPQDSVIVIEFDQSVRVLTKATNDREKIYKAIRRAGFGDGTSLYEAVDDTLRRHLSKIGGRKAVVLFTDGVDTTSRTSSYERTLDLAEEADALIFPIYYNTFSQMRGMTTTLPSILMGPQPAGNRSEDYALGRTYLQELAESTGGRVFRPDATPGGLTAAFEGIAEELRRQYSIGYVPKDEGKPGQRKQIKVRVDRPNLVLRARDSYIVGATAPQSPDTVPPTK